MYAEEKILEKETYGERLEKEILTYTPQRIKNVISKACSQKLKNIEEIRFRAEKPLLIQNSEGDWFIDGNNRLSSNPLGAVTVSQSEILKTLELMSDNSIYAYQDEIKNGFITLRGGHRVGIVGRVIQEGNSIKNIKDISGLNIRVSREVPGCSFNLAKYILKGKSDVYNTLLVSPPQCGKTTMLRDISRILSDGLYEAGFKGIKVGIIDERSEIAASYKGVAQNEVGIRTDVLDGCPKTAGMVMMLRSMSPQVIVTDEIGNEGDKEAVMKVVNAGVKIIASAHGYNISELKTRKEVLSLMEEKVFDRYIVLSSRSGPGTLEEVIDGRTLNVIYKGG